MCAARSSASGPRGADARPGRRRLDRQRHVDRRDPPERVGPVPLRDVEARDLGADEDDGARARPRRDPRQRRRPGPSLTEGAVEFVEAGAPEGIDVEAQWGAYQARIPLRRLAHPDDVARAALFLASDLGAYVSGAQLVVDGGLLAA